MNGLVPVLTRTGALTRPGFDVFDRIFEDFGRIPRPEQREWTPALDVLETEAEWIVQAEVPGLARDEIDITITEGVLTIKGEKNQAENEEAVTRRITERAYGPFMRALRLPDTIDQTKVSAVHKDGVLAITIPKAEKEKPRKIEIG